MPRLLYRRGVHLEALGARVVALGDYEADLRSLHAKIDLLNERQSSLHRWTKIGTYATIAGVVVAAARLGVISIPLISARRRRR